MSVTVDPIVDVIALIQEKYKEFNVKFFGSKLPILHFVVDTKCKMGFRFESCDGSIHIGLKYLVSDSNRFSTELIHEMIHVFNWTRNIRDHNNGQYHNQEFCKVAVSLGFFVLKHSAKGFGVLSLTPVSGSDAISPSPTANDRLQRIIDVLQLEDDSSKTIEDLVGQLNKEKKIFQYKYVCECQPPHNSIHTGRSPKSRIPFKATCNHCNKNYKCVDF